MFISDCGTPPVVANSGAPVVTSMVTGGRATYTCIPGYITVDGSGNLASSATITCQSTGVWSIAPVCTQITAG